MKTAPALTETEYLQIIDIQRMLDTTLDRLLATGEMDMSSADGCVSVFLSSFAERSTESCGEGDRVAPMVRVVCPALIPGRSFVDFDTTEQAHRAVTEWTSTARP